jgi:hypothetical protein
MKEAAVISEILTIFRADTSEMRSAVKDLKGDQKELAKAELDAANARNQQLENWIGKTGRVKAGLEATKSSFMMLSKSMEVLGVEGGRVTDALGSMGVVMSTIGGPAGIVAGIGVGLGHAAVALGNWQKETNEARLVQEQFAVAQQRTKDAVTEGTEAVRIAYLDMTQLAIKTALGTDALKGFTQGFLEADAKIRASAFAKMFMAGDDIDAFGKVAQGGFGPKDDIDKFTALTMRGKDYDESGVRASTRIAAREKDIDLANKELAALERQWDSYGHGALSTAMYDQEKKRLQDTINGSIAGHKKEKEEVDEYAKFLKELSAPIDKVIERQSLLSQAFMNGRINAEKYNDEHAKLRDTLVDLGHIPVKSMAGSIEVVDYTQGLKAPGEQKYESAADAFAREQGDRRQQLANLKQADNQSFLESTFGKLEDFDAYAQAFQMLTGATTAAMDAWISGSMSAGQAVKKFLADALKGLASQMAVEALKHAAYGIGSLAFGDLSGAGRHAAAAAAFGGAAVAAGAAAKALGSGGGGGASGGGGGGGSSSAGGSGSSGGSVSGPSGSDSEKSRPVYILVGDSFSEDSPRMRQIRANEAMEKALRERDE